MKNQHLDHDFTCLMSSVNWQHLFAFAEFLLYISDTSCNNIILLLYSFPLQSFRPFRNCLDSNLNNFLALDIVVFYPLHINLNNKLAFVETLKIPINSQNDAMNCLSKYILLPFTSSVSTLMYKIVYWWGWALSICIWINPNQNQQVQDICLKRYHFALWFLPNSFA